MKNDQLISTLMNAAERLDHRCLQFLIDAVEANDACLNFNIDKLSPLEQIKRMQQSVQAHLLMSIVSACVTNSITSKP